MRSTALALAALVGSWGAPLVVTLAGCDTVRAIQARSILGPMPSRALPEPGLRVEVAAPDGVHLHGYFVRASGPSRGTVLFFHGAGSQAAFWSDEAVRLAAEGYDAVAFDNRGHGASGGLCTYGALEQRDVPAILDGAARLGANVTRVVLFGYSMGAGVALLSAQHEPRVRGVVAVAPFLALDSMVARVAWAIRRQDVDAALAAASAVGHFAAWDVRPIAAAAALRVPLLVVAGSDDYIAPAADARALAAAAATPNAGRSRLLIVQGAGHDDVLDTCGTRCAQALRWLLGQAGMGRAP